MTDTTTRCTRCGRHLTEATTYLSRDGRPYCSRDLDRLPSYLRPAGVEDRARLAVPE